jgi:putative pyridoxal-dependent aspartate 1-decarboxylase
VFRLFSMSGHTAVDELDLDRRILNLASDAVKSEGLPLKHGFASLSDSFNESQIPPDASDIHRYLDYLAEQVIPHSVNVSSPRSLPHMTSALPYFMKFLAKLMTSLNQNMVKAESSKAFTPFERQAIAMLHRLVYKFPDDFYSRYTQHRDRTLGIILSGSTQANITALWCARNVALGPRDGFEGVEAAGLPAALDFYGFKGAAVIGSSLMHYSIEKAAGLLGLGSCQLLRIPVGDDNRISLKALRKTITECRSERLCVLAIVGVAGSTDVGSIDPLEGMAEIAQEFGTHFHVDAAWGGPILFSDKYACKLAGIERADSVTIDGHKQLHLPVGVGALLMRNPLTAQAIAKYAHYTLRPDSPDLGKRTL